MPSEESFIESTALMAGCSNIKYFSYSIIHTYFQLLHLELDPNFFIVRSKMAGFVLIMKNIVLRKVWFIKR